MAGKRPRLRTALIVASVIVAVCALSLAIRNHFQDRPIVGGIVAYRSHSLDGMRHTHCLCGHRGFYLLTDQLVLWYLTGHDSLQPEGEIVGSEGNMLTVQPIEEPLEGEEPPKPYTIEKRERKIHIVMPATEYSPVADYTLKMTYLGPEVRKRVEDFDFEEWKASQEER